MYLSLESSDSVAEYYAVDDIVTGFLETPDDFAKKVQAVTKEQILALAKEIFTNNRLVLAMIGNVADEESIKVVTKL